MLDIQINGGNEMTKLEWLKRPSIALVAMVIGAIIGIYYKELSQLIAPFGELYLSFLKMLVIPIMVTAVITSMGKLLASREAAHYLKRMLVTFLMFFLLASILGIGIGFIGKPGSDLSQNAREVLGSTMMSGEESISKQNVAEEDFSAMDFLKMLIPKNLFQSLVGEQNLQVLFVAILFGVAIGTIREEKRDDVLSFFEITYKSFEKMISWTMYALPIGLLCIISNQFANMGTDLLYSMTKFIVIIYISCGLLIGFSAIVIWKEKNSTLIKSTIDLKEPLLIAFGTRNSLATLPFIFQVLQRKYQLKDEAINLVVPLSIIICRYSMVIVFSIGTVFVAQLYGISLGFSQMLIIVFGSIFAAIAGAGAPVLVSISMITLVLTPLKLPSDTAIVLLMAVIPIIDPILTVLNVHLTCSSSVLIDRPKNKSKDLKIMKKYKLFQPSN